MLAAPSVRGECERCDSGERVVRVADLDLSPILDGGSIARRHRLGEPELDGILVRECRCGVLGSAGRPAQPSPERTGNEDGIILGMPRGWPLWTSEVRPGREHDTTALREHVEVLPLLTAWTEDHLRTLGDLGYEGEADTITVAFKKPKNGELTTIQKTFNKAHNGLRAIGERGNSLLKMTFKALRNVSLCPRRIGKIVAAALVLLHVEHDRTT